jgi:hypothetical protein
MISLDEIKKIQGERKSIKKEIYKKIYSEHSRRIKKAVEIGQDQIILETPSYMFGFPSYNIYKATLYIKRQFDISGFTTYLFSEHELYISWAQDKREKHRVPSRDDKDDEENYPTFVNLKKMANKLRKH